MLQAAFNIFFDDFWVYEPFYTLFFRWDITASSMGYYSQLDGILQPVDGILQPVSMGYYSQFDGILQPNMPPISLFDSSLKVCSLK